MVISDVLTFVKGIFRFQLDFRVQYTFTYSFSSSQLSRILDGRADGKELPKDHSLGQDLFMRQQ